MVRDSELGFVINPGKMRYPVTITNARFTRSMSGELIDDGNPVTFQVMAARSYGSGGEKVTADIDAAQQGVTYATRYDARITTKSKLTDGGQVYDVESIRIIGPLRYMVISVKSIRYE